MRNHIPIIMHPKSLSRKSFLKISGLGLSASLLTPNILGSKLKNLMEKKALNSHKTNQPLKFALCGLGNYAHNWIAPAIVQSEHAELTAIITGSPDKVSHWQNKYSIKDDNVYDYQTLDRIKDNLDIDCVYIATPTGNHAELTIRSFEAGKHVICEKPMAPTVADCDRMINAAKKANKTLQIGYRLYWDPFNMDLMQAMRELKYGSLKGMKSGFSYDQGSLTRPGDWRLTQAMNVAGALYDIGVYVVQSAFYSAQGHPLSVTASHSTDRADIFKEIPEHWDWQFEWPNGLSSQHSSSYGRNENYVKLKTEAGSLALEPAFSYKNIAGHTPTGAMNYPEVFQQKLQIDGQSLAILGQSPSSTPGEMGRRDIQALTAIMEAADTGASVKFNHFDY